MGAATVRPSRVTAWSPGAGTAGREPRGRARRRAGCCRGRGRAGAWGGRHRALRAPGQRRPATARRTRAPRPAAPTRSHHRRKPRRHRCRSHRRSPGGRSSKSPSSEPASPAAPARGRASSKSPSAEAPSLTVPAVGRASSKSPSVSDTSGDVSLNSSGVGAAPSAWPAGPCGRGRFHHFAFAGFPSFMLCFLLAADHCSSRTLRSGPRPPGQPNGAASAEADAGDSWFHGRPPPVTPRRPNAYSTLRCRTQVPSGNRATPCYLPHLGRQTRRAAHPGFNQVRGPLRRGRVRGRWPESRSGMRSCRGRTRRADRGSP